MKGRIYPTARAGRHAQGGCHGPSDAATKHPKRSHHDGGGSYLRPPMAKRLWEGHGESLRKANARKRPWRRGS
jgi:hypothetical protein